MAAVSIIVPVLNDDENLHKFLSRYHLSIRPFCDSATEVIVVIAGESQSGAAICNEFSVNWISAPTGRGVQLNLGAKQAVNDMLWFLHVDTQITEKDVSLVENLASPCWGCFDHYLLPRTFSRDFIAFFDNVRARYFQTPYGDQGIFCSRDLFEQVSGFPETPILEDVIISERLRKLQRIHVLKKTIYSDARRWNRLGVLKTTLVNWKVMYHHYRGDKSYEEIRNIYDDARLK